MGDFKINKVVSDEPKYCDYIQQKIDIAKENGATYELDDEDRRIQSLYDQQDLVTKDDIKTLDRVLSQGDGQEYLVVSKNVNFYTQQSSGGQNILVYKDCYSTNEGIVELPLKTINEDGVTQTNQRRLVYTIPFSASVVDEYLQKAGGKPVSLRFYEGAVTSNRLPASIPRVGSRDYFVDATWTELLYGKEKKVIDSMVSRLPEVRKDLKTSSGNDNSSTGTVKTTTNTTIQDTNKQVTENKSSGTGTTASSSTGTGTGSGSHSQTNSSVSKEISVEANNSNNNTKQSSKK